MNVYLYLLDTLSDWEIGYLMAELNSGRLFKQPKVLVNIVKLGSSTLPIQTMGGITIAPDAVIDDAVFGEGDVLILPGADTWFDENNLRVIDMMKELIDKNITVAAICGATLALASKGVLDNRKHTSNDKAYLTMTCPDYRGLQHYIDSPAVSDGNLITASGIAPVEFTYEVLNSMKVMRPETLDAWYQLNLTKNPRYFHAMINSLH